MGREPGPAQVDIRTNHYLAFFSIFVFIFALILIVGLVFDLPVVEINYERSGVVGWMAIYTQQYQS